MAGNIISLDRKVEVDVRASVEVEVYVGTLVGTDDAAYQTETIQAPGGWHPPMRCLCWESRLPRQGIAYEDYRTRHCGPCGAQRHVANVTYGRRGV